MSFHENKEENIKNVNSEETQNGSHGESSIPADDSEHLPVMPETDADKITALTAEVESLNSKLLETNDRMLRIAADADNYRKRLEKEKIDARLYSIQEFAKDLLPVIDSFDKALQTIENVGEAGENGSQLASMAEGVKLVSKIFQDVIKKHGIERLPGVNAPFNPMYHNAIAKITDPSYKVETVAEEFMSGYKISDRVLRTALVKVGSPD